MERVHLDILGPFTTSSIGNKYVLVMIDQFTKWILLPSPSSPPKVALRFLNNFIFVLGLPLQVHTDQGTNFESNLFRAFCDTFQVTKTRTTPYHPSSNGQVERYNRVLLPMIRSYIGGNQQHWDRDLSLLGMVLCATVHRQTSFTPNRRMLGRETFQPIDLMLGTPGVNHSPSTPGEWAQSLKDQLSQCHRLAQSHLDATQERQKKDYDLRKLLENSYQPGDLVWKIHQARKKGSSFKLENPRKGPFVVVKSSPSLYTIEGQRSKNVVHHDKLTPCKATEAPLWIRRKRHSLTSEVSPPEMSFMDPTVPPPPTSTPRQSSISGAASPPPKPPPHLDLSQVETDFSPNVSSEISLSEQDSPCGACSQMVTPDDDAICCDGPCQSWYHKVKVKVFGL